MDYTVSEIEFIIIDYVNEVLLLADLSEEVVVKGVKLYGSRTRDDYIESSDLDVLIEYEGDLKEYIFYNMLNVEDDEGPLLLNNIKVDFNPIRPEESGTIEEYYKRVSGFRKRPSNVLSLEEQIDKAANSSFRSVSSDLSLFNCTNFKEKEL